jgi:hypothetical protein
MSIQDHPHRQTWDLIPLLINGSAPHAERALAQAHLSGCADCRDELAFQMHLLAGMTADAETAAVSDPHAGLRCLLQRIDEEDPSNAARQSRSAGARDRRSRRPSARRPSRRLLAAVLLQSVALVLLGVFVLVGADKPGAVVPNTPSGADYRVLSQPGEPVADAMIRLVPAPDLSMAALQSLLAESGLRIVSANKDNTIYSLALPALSSVDEAGRNERVSTALARLRAQPGILLAEPIVADSSDPGLR